MIENIPLKSLCHKGLTIEGYSRAAVQTCWRVGELDVGFDLGASPLRFVSTSNWLITHCHLDHAAALPSLLRARQFLRLPAPQIYLPLQALSGIKQLLQICKRLDRSALPCELIGVEPGQDLKISEDHMATVFATRHTIPSVGYLIGGRRPTTLETEHRAPQNATDERPLCPLVCYLGDTAPDGLDAFPDVYSAQILITELTFVDPAHRRDRIHKHGHLHLDDLVARADRFQNELIIAAHFTARSTDRQIRRYVERALPDSLRGRLHLWI